MADIEPDRTVSEERAIVVEQLTGMLVSLGYVVKLQTQEEYDADQQFKLAREADLGTAGETNNSFTFNPFAPPPPPDTSKIDALRLTISQNPELGTDEIITRAKAYEEFLRG